MIKFDNKKMHLKYIKLYNNKNDKQSEKSDILICHTKDSTVYSVHHYNTLLLVLECVDHTKLFTNYGLNGLELVQAP